ncbi:transcription antitermination factor NusB [Longibacter salinarum]|uniref:Transcription antitermination protein NusB n=1 Tax=Longibacter salinarum TaxID=1850348 RepID=A0A2A8CV54_9BACT|nr:transcription antitermination factor NusB [Longibacter salinarum]PEN12572.1 transcription antitermination factor NusB [Longibacter salinarum]
MSTRREAREYVMKALYALEMGGGDARHVVYTILEPALEGDAVTLEFARKLLTETVNSRSEADAVISKHAKNWDIDRITPVDRILLRMAIIELLKMEDVPPKVSIDEAIEIAKSYSTPKSGTFINGILDAALADLKEQGRLNKSGRGLVGMDLPQEQEEASS